MNNIKIMKIRWGNILAANEGRRFFDFNFLSVKSTLKSDNRKLKFVQKF